jgi:hypothetical protein
MSEINIKIMRFVWRVGGSVKVNILTFGEQKSNDAIV